MLKKLLSGHFSTQVLINFKVLFKQLLVLQPELSTEGSALQSSQNISSQRAHFTL
jgi:hypothetical protein